VKNREPNFDLIQEYLGFNGRSIVFFLAILVGTVAVVTCIYTAIFGYDTWQNNMDQAGSLMLSNLEVPPTDPNTAGPVGPNVVPAAGTGGCQLLCPTCGVVDRPNWNAQGDPICPTCGGMLQVAGGGTASRLAA